uniref:C2H2-type domain-containing protein n=2 Tax=Oryza brachyantha TaxID=4533 RepID=J3MMJ1_ORYBR
MEEYLATSLLMLAHGVRNKVNDTSGLGHVQDMGSTPVAVEKPSQQEYKCSVCGKVYMCYQALGGHMTRHRKLLAQVVTDHKLFSNGSEATKMHRCSICPLAFTSRQALGGHKRVHYGGGVAKDFVKEKNVVKTKSMGEPKAVLKDFDLNLPAVATTVGDKAKNSPPEAKRV